MLAAQLIPTLGVDRMTIYHNHSARLTFPLEMFSTNKDKILVNIESTDNSHHLLKTYNADEERNSFSTVKRCKNFVRKTELEHGTSGDFLEMCRQYFEMES